MKLDSAPNPSAAAEPPMRFIEWSLHGTASAVTICWAQAHRLIAMGKIRKTGFMARSLHGSTFRLLAALYSARPIQVVEISWYVKYVTANWMR